MKTGNKKSKHPIVKITLLSIIVIVIIAGIKECWLDFNQIPKETELAKQIGQPNVWCFALQLLALPEKAD